MYHRKLTIKFTITLKNRLKYNEFIIYYVFYNRKRQRIVNHLNFKKYVI